LPDGCADADAVAVLFDVAEVLGALVPQAVAVARIAAPRRVTATARRLADNEVGTVLLLGLCGAKDQTGSSIYRSDVQPTESIDSS
jgi:hypothetical protein